MFRSDQLIPFEPQRRILLLLKKREKKPTKGEKYIYIYKITNK